MDGNKRTGTLAAIAFLALNEVEVSFEEAEIVVMVVGLASSEISEESFASWLRGSTV